MKSLRALSLTYDPINLTRDSWFGSNLSYFAANTKDPKLISVDIFFMWKCYLDLAENLFSFPYTLCLPLPKGFFKLGPFIDMACQLTQELLLSLLGIKMDLSWATINTAIHI